MKYNIEGDFNFYDELYKTLDDNDKATNEKDDDNICLITQLPLTDNYVTMECKHKFNYGALYKEIYNQKCKLKTYDSRVLPRNIQNKMRDLHKDYFIRCPYCRNVQFELLPDLNSQLYPRVYGINTDDRRYTQVIDNNTSGGFVHKGFFYDTTKSNKCEYESCSKTLTAFNDQFKMFCCTSHMGKMIKQKVLEQKLVAKMKLKDEKQKLVDEKQKLKEEAQKLKQEQKKAKKAENTIIAQNDVITTFIPDHLCSAILKTGLKKGTACGAKAYEGGLCRRHCPKIVPTSDVGETLGTDNAPKKE